MNSGTMFLVLLLSAVGMAFFVYGRRQKRGMALLSGIVLCVSPYFVSNTLALIAIAIVFIALPFVIRTC